MGGALFSSISSSGYMQEGKKEFCFSLVLIVSAGVRDEGTVMMLRTVCVLMILPCTPLGWVFSVILLQLSCFV